MASPFTVSKLALIVRFDDAVAAFVVPSENITRYKPALFTVLNPVPLEPADPDVPELPD